MKELVSILTTEYISRRLSKSWSLFLLLNTFLAGCQRAGRHLPSVERLDSRVPPAEQLHGRLGDWPEHADRTGNWTYTVSSG